MAMTRADLLNAIIDDGIEEARHTYTRIDQRQKLEGALEGFEACRGLNDTELAELLRRQADVVHIKTEQRTEDYWRHRVAMLQIEWTINVLSCANDAVGLTPVAGAVMTARGMLKAADILGVANKV